MIMTRLWYCFQFFHVTPLLYTKILIFQVFEWYFFQKTLILWMGSARCGFRLCAGLRPACRHRWSPGWTTNDIECGWLPESWIAFLSPVKIKAYGRLSTRGFDVVLISEEVQYHLLVIRSDIGFMGALFFTCSIAWTICSWISVIFISLILESCFDCL